MARGKTKVVVGELIFGVRVDVAQFDKSIDRLVKRTQQIGRSMEDAGKATAAAFAPATAAIALATRTGMQFATTLSDISARMDDSVSRIQALRTVAHRSGASYERMQKGLTNVLQRTNQAAGGNEAYRKAIASLGLDLNALIKLPVSRRMEEIARAYVNATDKGKAYNAMTQLVGTFSTPELIVALRKLGTEGLDSLMQKYIDLGLIVDDTVASRLSEAQGVVDHLGNRFKVFSTNMAVLVAPSVEKAVAVVTILMQRIEQLDPAVVSWAMGMSAVGAATGVALIAVGKIIGPVAALTGGIVKLTASLAVMTAGWISAVAPVALVVSAIAAAVGGVLFLSGQLDGIIKDIAGEKMSNAIFTFRDNFIDAVKAIGEWLYTSIYNAIVRAWNESKNFLFRSDTGVTIAALLGITPSKANTKSAGDAELKTVQAMSSVARLGESGSAVKDGLGEFLDGMGGKLKESINGLGITDWLSKLTTGLKVSSDEIEGVLADIKDITKTGSDKTNTTLTSIDGTLKQNPYSKEQQDFAKKTLADIDSGKLSTSKLTRLEAQAIVEGRPGVEFKTKRFQNFNSQQDAIKSKSDAEWNEYQNYRGSLPWIVRDGFSDANIPIQEYRKNPVSIKNDVVADSQSTPSNIVRASDSVEASASALLQQIIDLIRTSNGYLQEIAT